MIILIIAICFVIGAFALNALYKRTNSYQNQFIDVRKFSVKGGVGNNLEIVNLGSNHPKFGFDYSGLNVKGDNWAVGPQTLEYDFSILRKNESHLASGAIVVIPICLLKLFLYRQNSRAIHLKYYSFLNSQDIVGFSKKEQICNYMFPLFFHPRAIRSLIRDAKKDNRLLLDKNLCDSEEKLNNDADLWIDCWDKEFCIKLPSPSLSQENRNDISKNIQILKDMIDYCISKELKPVIAILPVTNNLYSRFTSEFIEQHILSYISAANVAKVPVLNYLTDERFTDPSLYINSFFFNTNGRKKFTKQFINDLRAQSIL